MKTAQACSEEDNSKITSTNSVQGSVLTPDDQIAEDDEGELSKDEQVTLLIDMMNECMKALFRIGVLVRREGTYDRFQRALQRSRFSFPEQFDTDYVEQKYPKLRSRARRGLATRLGRANAKRRQVIKYGRDHRTRLEMDVDFRQEIEPEVEATPSVNLEAPTEKLSSKATTFVMPAEHWNSSQGFLEAPIEDEDDSGSLLTASTTFDSERSLKLVSLADIGPEGEHFECPLCFTLQCFRTERAWRYVMHRGHREAIDHRLNQCRIHAYDDLKAYICTYGGKDCDSEMFVDRATWFNHELRVHRACFTCKLCGEQMGEEEGLRNHVLSDHVNFPSAQLSMLLEQGRLVPSQLKARDCPFCDDWARSLSSRRNPPEGGTESEQSRPDVLVALSKFKKHVAIHQEQLAIFTVPKSIDHDGPDDSGQNAGSDVSVHVSEGSPAPDASGASDTFVVGSEGVDPDKDRRNHAEDEKDAEERRPRVLIAEDNPVNLAVLRRLLFLEGIRDITAAKDGQEAYDIVKENFDRNDMFDLIFMDIQMPRLSGLASARLMRVLGCEAPIVAMTPASSDPSRAHELIQRGRGLSDVILKPFRQPRIRKVLQRFAIVPGDAGKSSSARELYMHDSYETPTVDVESLISPLEAFLATASSEDQCESASDDADISSVTAVIAEALSGPERVRTADLIDVLPNLHHNKIMNLRTQYKKLVKVGAERKGVNVAKHIRARLKDEDNRLMAAAYATALGMWESEGYWISLPLAAGDKSRKGYQLLIESLFGRPNTETRLIEDGFRFHSNKLEREHGTSLGEFLDPYLRQGEAWFREAVEGVLSGHKMEERDQSGQPLPIDMQLVEKDVDELFEAVAGERGAATTISQIVVLRSDAHLREVLTIYQRKYDSDLFTDALKGTMQLRVSSCRASPT